MREIVGVQVGNTGLTLGAHVYSILKELDPSESEVYYRETSSGERVPRSIWVDLDPQPIGELRHKHSWIPSDSVIFGQSGAGNNWAKGYYTEGMELIESFGDVLRRETEKADGLQGFRMMHSMSGGTGGGMGALISAHMREYYPSSIIDAFSVAPTTKVGGCVVHGYNVIFSLAKLQESADRIEFMEQNTLYDIWFKEAIGGELINFPEQSEFTSSSLIPQIILCGASENLSSRPNLRNLDMSLCPIPNLRLTTTSTFKPWISRITRVFSKDQKTYHLRTIRAEILERYNLAGVKPLQTENSALISSWTITPPHIQQQPLEADTVRTLFGKNSTVSAAILPIPLLSNTSNSSTVHVPLDRWSEIFTAMFRRRAFTHWYTSEGMDEMEFTQGQDCIIDISGEYQELQDWEFPQLEDWKDNCEGDTQSLATGETRYDPPQATEVTEPAEITEI